MAIIDQIPLLAPFFGAYNQTMTVCDPCHSTCTGESSIRGFNISFIMDRCGYDLSPRSKFWLNVYLVIAWSVFGVVLSKLVDDTIKAELKAIEAVSEDKEDDKGAATREESAPASEGELK